MEVYQDGIRPQSFKNLIGKGHEEFSSGRQQDSQEYLQYFMEVIEKEEVKRGRENPCQMFNFGLEHRYECQACKGVAYIPEKTNQLNLLIMKDSDEEMIPEEEEMKNGLERFLSDEAIEKDCPGCSGKQTFLRRTRFLNFPEVMIVVAQRFTFQNWTPTKINTSLKVILDDLDLTPYKVSGGVQEGETALPDGGEVEVEVDVEINQDQLNQCLMMGLPELAAKHALHSTGNSGADAAVTWYFSNMENPVINGPLPKEKKMVKQGGFAAPVEEEKVEEAVSVDEGSFSMLAGMGMDPERSRKALIKFNNNLEQALDYITSHGPEEDEFEEEKQDAPKAKEWIVDPRPGVYDLNAFITHLGNSIHSGHYVAHIKKGEDWVLYNDNKVVITSDPPHDKAFVYFYKKKD